MPKSSTILLCRQLLLLLNGQPDMPQHIQYQRVHVQLHIPMHLRHHLLLPTWLSLDLEQQVMRNPCSSSHLQHHQPHRLFPRRHRPRLQLLPLRCQLLHQQPFRLPVHLMCWFYSKQHRAKVRTQRSSHLQPHFSLLQEPIHHSRLSERVQPAFSMLGWHM